MGAKIGPLDLRINPDALEGMNEEHEVPLWQYLVRGLLNSLFSTHCYHIKLQNLHSPFQEHNPNGGRFDQLTSELKKYEKLEQRFPSPGLPGEQKILTSELS
jgi:hypothetical protein